MGHIGQHSIRQRRQFIRLGQSRQHGHCAHSSRTASTQIMGAVTHHDAGRSWDLHFIRQSQQWRGLWFCAEPAVTADNKIKQT